jgi:putative flippase GtrA
VASAYRLTDRLRRVAPEALAFGTIGLVNTALSMIIVWLALPIGAVKASVLATVITATLAYFANRHWTYRHRSGRQNHREFALFFVLNLAGLVIQSGVVAMGKYGLGFNEADDQRHFAGLALAGIGLATLFRFWAYRTFVFLEPTGTAGNPLQVHQPVSAGGAAPPADPHIPLAWYPPPAT